jgi:hypothetical protein
METTFQQAQFILGQSNESYHRGILAHICARHGRATAKSNLSYLTQIILYDFPSLNEINGKITMIF